MALKIHQFYTKYANVSLSDRLHILDFQKHGLSSLEQIYQQIKRLDDEIQPKLTERDKLIESVEEFILKHQAKEENSDG